MQSGGSWPGPKPSTPRAACLKWCSSDESPSGGSRPRLPGKRSGPALNTFCVFLHVSLWAEQPDESHTVVCAWVSEKTLQGEVAGRTRGFTLSEVFKRVIRA